MFRGAQQQSARKNSVDVKTLALVVDDEPGILRFVKVGLTHAGFKVVATTSGVQALEFARTGEPDIIILDLYMEPLTGFDVLKEVRTFSPVPVIIITARREAAQIALALGANSYVLKPFLPEQLAREIRRVINEVLDSET